MDYDDRCVVPEDCEAVLDRGFCGSCGNAGWVVLSAEGAAAFEDDQDQYEEEKECPLTLAMVCIFGDPPPVACDEGQCVPAARR